MFQSSSFTLLYFLCFYLIRGPECSSSASTSHINDTCYSPWCRGVGAEKPGGDPANNLGPPPQAPILDALAAPLMRVLNANMAEPIFENVIRDIIKRRSQKNLSITQL